jgi:hypothetical protein
MGLFGSTDLICGTAFGKEFGTKGTCSGFARTGSGDEEGVDVAWYYDLAYFSIDLPIHRGTEDGKSSPNGVVPGDFVAGTVFPKVLYKGHRFISR